MAMTLLMTGEFLVIPFCQHTHTTYAMQARPFSTLRKYCQGHSIALFNTLN